MDASIKEGHLFVDKTLVDWNSGKNRFSKNGECFLLAYENSRLIGCCGVNVDPYLKEETVGRLRHLYVDPNYRRIGIGGKLVAECLKAAKPHFSAIRLRANSINLDSHEFYRNVGFSESTKDCFETHVLEF